MHDWKETVEVVTRLAGLSARRRWALMEAAG